ncbi:MAG TPA: type II secretion system F family protein [Vicinamibacterales bacterium]|nr:type II secretion system F family protein [Vicinamibacterales bacterium]
MGFLLLFLIFLFGAGLALLAYYGFIRLPDAIAQKRVEERLDQIHRFDDEEKAPRPELIKGIAEGPLPVLDRLFGQSTRGNGLSRWVEQSGMKKATVSGVLLTAFALAVLGAVLATTMLHNAYALPACAAAGFALPFLVLRQKRVARLRKFEETFPEALDLIARSLKAGHAFSSGLKMVADELGEPVGPEFRKTFDEQNFGLPLKDALDNLSMRVPLLDVRFFSTAVMIQRDTGGNLAEILENLAHVVRERFKILRQVRVYTAHGRLTGYVLLALPFALAIALSFINPDHMNMLFRERLGQMLLGVAAVMQVIGYFWIRQVIKIEV